mgnify:CR=1 FL=1
MKLVLLGPPGAGKGTMANRIAADFGHPHISTGEIFRANIKQETSLGCRVRSILGKGDLVPDEITIELVRERLQENDAQNGFILDGFPRTIAQADALSGMCRLDHVINLVVTDQEAIRRLSGRRIHPGSGRTYHVEFDPPRRRGEDDVTGEPLVQREDDREDSIRNRLEVYRNSSAPLIEYYREQELLSDIDAMRHPDEVFASVHSLIEAL